jgi:hypothetical protein
MIRQDSVDPIAVVSLRIKTSHGICFRVVTNVLELHVPAQVVAQELLVGLVGQRQWAGWEVHHVTLLEKIRNRVWLSADQLLGRDTRDDHGISLTSLLYCCFRNSDCSSIR